MSLREIEKWEIDANMEKDRDLFYWRNDFSHLIESHKFIIRGARGLGKSAIMNNLLIGENTVLVRLQDAISEGSHAQLRKQWQLFIEREISEQLRMKVQSLVSKSSRVKKYYFSLENELRLWIERIVNIFGAQVKEESQRRKRDRNISFIRSNAGDITQIFVVFDEIDTFMFNAVNEQKAIFSALVKAVYAFQDRVNQEHLKIRLFIFIREDIYQELDLSPIRVRVESQSWSIHWTKAELKELLEHRLSKLPGASPLSGTIRSEVGYKEKIEFIIDYSLGRPRDLVQMIKIAASIAKGRGEIESISAEDLRQMLTQYRSWLIRKDLVDELSFHSFEHIEECLTKIFGRGMPAGRIWLAEFKGWVSECCQFDNYESDRLIKHLQDCGVVTVKNNEQIKLAKIFHENLEILDQQ